MVYFETLQSKQQWKHNFVSSKQKNISTKDIPSPLKITNTAPHNSAENCYWFYSKGFAYLFMIYSSQSFRFKSKRQWPLRRVKNTTNEFKCVGTIIGLWKTLQQIRQETHWRKRQKTAANLTCSLRRNL